LTLIVTASAAIANPALATAINTRATKPVRVRVQIPRAVVDSMIPPVASERPPQSTVGLFAFGATL
jgi:hypothetical protein